MISKNFSNPNHVSSHADDFQEQLQITSFALESVSDGVLITDANGIITSANNSFYSITGWSKKDIIGRTCSFLQGPESSGTTRELIQKSFRDSTDFRGEILNFRKDGTPFWNDLSILPVRNDKGQVTHFVGIIRDTTALRRAESVRVESMKELYTFANYLPGMVYQFCLRADGSFYLPFVSESCQDLYQLTPAEIKSNPSLLFDCVISDQDAAQNIWDSIQKSAKEMTPWSHEYKIQLPDGSQRWLHGHSLPRKEADGSILWHGLVTDITERKNLNEEIKQLGFYDTLTGLANRRLLSDRLSQALLMSERTKKFGAILFIDLDKFKPLNDQYGHCAGDELLKQIANQLKTCVRATDSITRYGGDEFVILMNALSADKADSVLQAMHVAEKIQAVLSQTFSLSVKHDGLPTEHFEHASSASIGVTLFLGNQFDQAAILKMADTAMYEAKRRGTGKTSLYMPRHE